MNHANDLSLAFSFWFVGRVVVGNVVEVSVKCNYFGGVRFRIVGQMCQKKVERKLKVVDVSKESVDASTTFPTTTRPTNQKENANERSFGSTHLTARM